MKKQIVILLSLLLAPNLAQCTNDPVVTIVTEDLFIIGYSKKERTKEGYHRAAAAKFVEHVLSTANISYKPRILPWSRALSYARNKRNILIFPIARNQLRESQYIWIGPIFPALYSFYKLKERVDIRISSLEQAKKYRVGVNNHSVHHSYLNSHGFVGLQPVNNDVQNLKKLLKGRIDIFPKSKIGMMSTCRDIQVDCELVEVAFRLPDTAGDVYIAFSPGTDRDIIERTQASYAKAVADGTFQRLLGQYLD